MPGVRCRGTRRRPRAARRPGDGQRWGGGVLLEGWAGALCDGCVVGSGSGVGWIGARAGTLPSSTERGAALFDDIKASSSETNKKIAAHHQGSLVMRQEALRPA